SRRIISQTNESHNGIIRNGIMVPISDNQINHVLPSRSDKKPKMSKPTINPAIVMDKDRLDVDTETPNVSTNTGSNGDRKSTRLNSSHVSISYAVFCLKKKKTIK